MLKNNRGQAATEYILASAMFLVIFSILYQIIQGSLKKLFASAAVFILTSHH